MTGMKDNIRVGMDLKDKGTKTPPKLISRKFYVGVSAVETVYVPSNASFAILRCIGSGGAVDTGQNSLGGGGGAFAKRYLTVKPGMYFQVSVDRYSGAPTTIYQKGNLVCKAQPGLSASAGGNGGQLYGCVGDVVRAGQDALQNVPGGAKGGDAANDLMDDDTIGLYGSGADSRTPGSDIAAMGWGGGGAHSASPNTVANPRNQGIAVFEFYTFDPRGIIS